MSSLAIVERKPPLNGGGGCAGGVLFHLLDWHRRLARKRRLFSPRRLLPSSLRSAPRRLPAPPPTLTTPPPPAPHTAAGADGAAPGVVARLMGLESWPGGSTGAPRPQKQRKVEASPPDGGESAVVLVLPTTRRPPAPAPAPAATAAPRSHHGSDLPARSPRRTRLVHAAAAKLLEPGARASSRASARLALAYACSSPQHRKDGHSGALLQGSGMADNFLSRSGGLSLDLDRSTRLQPHVRPAETECDRAAVSRRHRDPSFNSGNAGIGASTVVLPRMDFGVANMGKSDSDADAVRRERRIRNEGISTCAKVRSSIPSVRDGDERLRKRSTPTRTEVSGSVDPLGLASSTRQFGRAQELKTSAGRRISHHSSPGPRRDIMGSVTRNTQCRDVINRSGLASTSRLSSNGSGPKRVSRKNVGYAAEAINTDDRNAIVFASRSSPKPVPRASAHSNVSKSGRPSRRAPNTTSSRMPAADLQCIEASGSVMATSEKDEFSRLLKAKINELGMSDRIEFTSSDTLSGKLTAPVLQELISALNNDMHTSTSQSSNCFEASAPLPLRSSGNSGCFDESGYAFSDDRSSDFQKFYQGEQDVDSSAASMNNEPNQPSPMSVLEACFSNDTSSLGSPVEKNESKDLFVSIEKKMKDLFNLESDIVNLEKSADTRKAAAEEIFHGDGMLSCLENFVAHDFKFLESRLNSIEEAISNVELLLGSGPTHGTTSALALHPFIMEMLETSAGVFGGELSLDLAEEKYQHTNFLFDCIIESLDSKFGYFGKCGYKAWLKLPLSLGKDQLKQELVEVIGNWKESGAALSRVADKELDQVTTCWNACQIEVFDISVSIEDDILEALAVELALDLW